MDHRPRRRVVKGKALAVAAASAVLVLVLATAGTERAAGACSCGGPEIALVSPDRVDDAPLNTKIRLELPNAATMRTQPGVTGPYLRTHDGEKVVVTTSRAIAPGGWLDSVDLTPTSPLAASTQYEIVMLDPSAIPSAIVIGTFKTATTADTTPPRLDAVGAGIAFKNAHASGAGCEVSGPWVIVEGIRAEDPGRPDAQLSLAIWLGDASGNVDTRKPPTAIRTTHDAKLHLGRLSICDPHDFPLPKTPVMWVGIAAVDEAGNTSAMRRVRVDIAGARTQ